MIKIKYILCISLVFLLSINSFAANVSDNDGSSFITKAEFDALKNNFQTQLDSYNQNIDSKIDSAIASYLSGMSVSTVPTEYWETITNTLGTKLYWKNNWGATTGSSTITPNYSINVARTSNLKADWGVHFFYLIQFWDGWGDKVYNATDVGSENAGTCGTVYVSSVGGTNANLDTADAYHRIIEWRGGKARQRHDDGTLYAWNEQQDYQAHAMIEKNKTQFNTAKGKLVNTNKTSLSASKSENSPGSGAAYVYHTQPDGTLELREYATVLYPNFSCQIYYHNYQNFSCSSYADFEKYHLTDHGRDFATATATLTPTLPTDWGTKIVGTKPVVTSTTDGANQMISTITLMKTTDGIEYNTYQYGGTVSASIYCVDELQKFTTKSTTKNLELKDMTWNDVYFKTDGGHLQTNTYNDITAKVKEIEYKTYSKKANDFTIQSLSSIAGENVKLGGGAPIVKFTGDDEKYKITLQFETTSTATSGNKVNYKISDKQFTLGNLTSGAKNIASGTVNVDTNVDVIVDTKKDLMLWITLDSTIANVNATIKSIILTKI